MCVWEESGPLEPGETQGHVGNFMETEGSREGLRSAETLEAIEKPVGVLGGAGWRGALGDFLGWARGEWLAGRRKQQEHHPGCPGS